MKSYMSSNTLSSGLTISKGLDSYSREGVENADAISRRLNARGFRYGKK